MTDGIYYIDGVKYEFTADNHQEERIFLSLESEFCESVLENYPDFEYDSEVGRLLVFDGEISFYYGDYLINEYHIYQLFDSESGYNIEIYKFNTPKCLSNKITEFKSCTKPIDEDEIWEFIKYATAFCDHVNEIMPTLFENWCVNKTKNAK